MGTEYDELGPLGRDLAIWEIHLRSTGKSTHTIKSYVQGVRALAGFLTDQGLPLDPEQITTRHLRAFQAHLLLPQDQGGAGKRTSTVCTRHDALKLFFSFLEEEDDLPNPMRRVQRPAEQEVTIQPLTEDQLAALIDSCRGKDFYDRRDMAIIRMWVSTPARLSEIALLRVVGADGEPDVDPLAGMIYVMGKGRRPRQMALSPKACKAAIRYEKVREQHPNARSPFYWLSHKKERFTQSGIRQMIARRPRGRDRPRPPTPVPPHLRDDVPRSRRHRERADAPGRMAVAQGHGALHQDDGRRPLGSRSTRAQHRRPRLI
jgi:site-specific recombinase XerD